MDPVYLSLSKKELDKRVNKLSKIAEDCEICPRKCHINRLKNEKGFCKLGKKPRVYAHHPHFGEEKPLVGPSEGASTELSRMSSGRGGSGTIFFTSCNLACIYCQNYGISQLRVGEEISFERLAQMMTNLQDLGCHNINFVTPTPQVPAIVKALSIAIEKGLKIPLVYNTNAYDSVETLKLLDGTIDIYMPDAKYSKSEIAHKYSQVSNYPETIQKAIKEMHRQVGDLIINDEGIAVKGLLVRHLVLPNNLAGSEKVFEFLAKEISKNTFLNIMDQYSPHFKAKDHPELSRMITEKEYRQAIELAKGFGLKRLYKE